MQLGSEILNIEYHKVRLVVTALSISDTMDVAADKCGLSKKSIYNYIKKYNIEKKGNLWYSNQLNMLK